MAAGLLLAAHDRDVIGHNTLTVLNALPWAMFGAAIAAVIFDDAALIRTRP